MRMFALRGMLCLLLLLMCLFALCGCTGGQEIEDSLFVLAMAIDPAPDGNLTVTVKALSGTQDASSGDSSGESGGEAGEAAQGGSPGTPVSSGIEQTESGYIVLSATASSCLRALGLLSVTTPRTVNLSQLREIVISRTLAETDATLSILREIHAMFRANSEAIVVVTPDDAGDFIRGHHAILGLRLSKYLEVLFDQYESLDIIPARATLSAVIAAMESGTIDATAVYAAGNAFDSPLVLSETGDTDRLPGHLPRTAPATDEYMGAALFDGPRMTGVLTGEQTGALRLMQGSAQRTSVIIDGAQYRVATRTHVTRGLGEDGGTLEISIRMTLSLVAGQQSRTAGEIAAQIETSAVNTLRTLQAASCDAVGFGRLAIRKSPDIASWEARDWNRVFEQANVRVTADVRIL